MSIPRFETKIIGGKLRRVPVYDSSHSWTGSRNYPWATYEPVQQVSTNKYPVLPPISDVKLQESPDPLSQPVSEALKTVSHQKLENVRAFFERLDRDNSGRITKKELLDVFLLYQIFILGSTMDELAKKFKVDGGGIDHKRLWRYLAECHPTWTAGQPDKLKEKPVKEKVSGFSAPYPAVSTNLGRTALSDRKAAKLLVDLELQLEKLGRMLDLSELRASCENCDRGETGLIGYKETKMLCKYYNLHNVVGSSLLEKILNKFDENGDGYVSWKEFLKFFEKATPAVHVPPPAGPGRETYKRAGPSLERKNTGNASTSIQTQTNTGLSTGSNAFGINHALRTCRKGSSPGPEPIRVNIRGRRLNVYPPDVYAGIEGSKDPPSARLELEWVYGYRGRDCRNNLFVLASGEVVYFIAAVAVMYNPRGHKQRHYTEHTDDIRSLAVHPDGVIVGTGQVAGHEQVEGQPHIRIWSSSSLETLAIVGLGSFERAVNSLAFSNKHGLDCGHFLVSLDDNDYHTITVWDWTKNKKIASARGHMDQVISATFSPYENNQLVSCGKQHVSFWSLDEGRLSCTRGRFDHNPKPKYVTCFTFSQAGDVITGDTNGTLYVWPEGSNQISVAVKNAHDGPVYALYTLPSGVVLSAGGRDSVVLAWDRRLHPTGVQMKLTPDVVLKLPQTVPGIRSLAVDTDALYIGTVSNDLWKTTLAQGNSPLTEARKGLKVLGEGHWESLRGLACHPSSHSFATSGSDKIVRLWDASSHRVRWSTTIPVPGGAVDISSNGDLIAVGCKDGSWMLLDSSNGAVKLRRKCASEKISDIKFSPDGLSVAVASHDNTIYMFKVQKDGDSTELNEKCKGHTSYVTHVDWSYDGKKLQSTSGDYELLYWDSDTCEQITSSEDMRNTEWASQNCILGYSVIGIWPPGADGTDVNFVDRSNQKNLLVTGDDFGDVNLFRFPCVNKKAERKVAKGHSAHVTSVGFLYDDSRVISVGGRDASIMQWRVA